MPSIGLPKNGDDGRVGEARRITFAVINVTDNVRGDLSAHVITVSELNRQKHDDCLQLGHTSVTTRLRAISTAVLTASSRLSV